MILGDMTHADKRINTQHFGTDLAHIRIRIRINPKIRIRIPDHILALAGMGKGNPLEMTNVWWQSGPGYGFRITFSFLPRDAYT